MITGFATYDTVVNAIPAAAVASTLWGPIQLVTAINNTDMHAIIRTVKSSAENNRHKTMLQHIYELCSWI
jgi:hypothetical protein